MLRKILLITLIVILVAIFTGTWIFGLFGDIFGFFENMFKFFEKIFNFFGWNKGMLCIGLGGIYA